MNDQSQQIRIPLSEKQFLSPLDINSLSYYWNHDGNFNLDLYEKILIAKQKKS